MMTPKEVGQRLIELCTGGRFFEAIDTLYADDVVSVEAGEPPMFAKEIRGIEGVRDKNRRWSDMNEVHEVRGDGPWPHDDRFAVRWWFDVTPQGGQRVQFDEIAVYTVRDGKIAKEEFFYDA